MDFGMQISDSSVNKTDLENRTKEFLLRRNKFVAALPKNRVRDVLGDQLLKSGTSVKCLINGDKAW
jgi:hypothetical protein